MIRLLLEPVNLLILDEPTNHLDMRSKDVLKDALREFDGTVIVVSHDREFLDGLVDKVYEFGNQRVIEHLGGIYEFLERKRWIVCANWSVLFSLHLLQVKRKISLLRINYRMKLVKNKARRLKSRKVSG